jgi:hypothetical protein
MTDTTDTDRIRRLERSNRRLVALVAISLAATASGWVFSPTADLGAQAKDAPKKEKIIRAETVEVETLVVTGGINFEDAKGKDQGQFIVRETGTLFTTKSDRGETSFGPGAVMVKKDKASATLLMREGSPWLMLTDKNGKTVFVKPDP